MPVKSVNSSTSRATGLPTRVDLNLLVVFEAIWRERHIGKASSSLSLSQPATSHALARLRKMIGDPLFERTRNGVRPTAIAEQIWPDVASALAYARTAIDRTFNPANLGRRVILGITNNVALPLLPDLLENVRKHSPEIDLTIRPITPDDAANALTRGHIDCVIGLWNNELPNKFLKEKLYEDEYVLVTAKQHEICKRKSLSVKEFIKHPQVIVSPSGDAYGAVDAALAQRGLSRRVMLVVSDYYLASEAIASTNLIGVMSAKCADTLAKRMGLAILPLPIKIKPVSIELVVPRWSTGLAKWLVEILT